MAGTPSRKNMRGVTETRDNMIIEWDVPITMDDGLVLRADIFRPIKPGQYATIASYGPYAKWLQFQDGYPTAWDIMVTEHPDVAANSTNHYQSWEVVDPEKWVRDDYVCVRVDSRGAGRSPGYIDHFSPRETLDFYHCIEWCAAQPWSNGKIGLAGISYYAINQWQVAGLQPPHLSAICIWEGAGDWYRDKNHHGGIISTMQANWYDMQVKTVQYGLGENGPVSSINGDLVTGPETLTPEQLAANRCAFGEMIAAHPVYDDYHYGRSAHWDDIKVPLLSCGNWGGNGLHLRGNVEGFVRAASEQKWLEMHGDRHWTLFYTDYGNALQKKFFGHFLKGEDTGWKDQPPVLLHVRHPGEKFVQRFENEWPIARTEWTQLYLDFETKSLTHKKPTKASQLSFAAMASDGVSFSMVTDREIELTGPSAAKLFVSSSTEDADIFLVIQVFDDQGEEVVFHGALDPNTPIAQGWLRASHRKLDPNLTTFYRPYHSHDEVQKLIPGQKVGLDVEIWPTCLVIPKGYTIVLNVRGKDYVYKGKNASGYLNTIKNQMTGCGPFLHNDPNDRPESVFGGTTTLYTAPGQEPYVILPFVPAK